MARHIHLLGASGTGTSTLGALVAERSGAAFLDTDRYYWRPTDPPFSEKRPVAQRLARIERDIAEHDDWVLSGSLCGWGDPLVPHFTLVVFLTLDPELRIARLIARERRRYGARIDPGGDMNSAHVEFLAWARRYDDAGNDQRSRALHESWLAELSVPVLRLDADAGVEALCSAVLAEL